MPDEMDRVQEACDRLLEEALGERFRQQRLASPLLNNSGICEDCDNPIPTARLAVQPNAERCVQCQNDFEMNSRRPV